MKQKIRVQILVNTSKQILKKAMLKEDIKKNEIVPLNKYQYSFLKRNNINFKIV